MSVATTPFTNPPLALTILEIRYPELSEGIQKRQHLELRESIRDDLPLQENFTEDNVEFAVGPGGGSSSRQRTTYPRFTTRDRTTAMLAREAALVIETSTYAGWEQHFRPLIMRLLTAFNRSFTPDGVTRIGLRYIDEIRIPGIDESPGEWTDYVAENLLAAADVEFVPETLTPTTWQGVVQYGTESGSRMTVRYGPREGYAVNPKGTTRRLDPPPPGLFFLLDIDSFWEGTDLVPPFEVDWILNTCDSIHKPTREFFRAATTDKLRTEVFERPRSNA